MTLRAAGRCLYCGATAAPGAPLTDEHIVPYGLNGSLVFPEASCSACQKITTRTERAVLRGVLGTARAHLGMRTRRPKERPKVFPLWTGEFQRKRLVPLVDHPHYLSLPEFEPADILFGLLRDDKKFREHTIWHYKLNPQAHAKHLRAGTYWTEFSVHINAFAEMLAKIGHAWAVAEHGFNGFKPLLPDMIAGRSRHRLRFVGAKMTRTLLGPGERGLHVLRSQWWPTPFGMRLVVEIQLFAELEAPVYHVVVGEPSD